MKPQDEALLSVVVPAYNEQEVLPEFHRRLSAALSTVPLRAEVIYVNDGSTDGTLAMLQDMRAHDPRIAIVDLSRNFGKEIALTAGLDHAGGDAVVVIDADLHAADVDAASYIPSLGQDESEAKTVVQMFSIIMASNIEITEDCVLRVRAFLGDDEVRLGALRVRIAEPIKEEATAH